MAECLNEPLCVRALVRKPEEKEPSYLCSLPALPHTLSAAEEKAHSARPAWGGRALFTLGLWETSPPYCACHLHMTHSFPKGPCEGGIRGTFGEFIKSLSHGALRALESPLRSPLFDIFASEAALPPALWLLALTLTPTRRIFCAVYSEVVMCFPVCYFNVRVKA